MYSTMKINRKIIIGFSSESFQTRRFIVAFRLETTTQRCTLGRTLVHPRPTPSAVRSALRRARSGLPRLFVYFAFISLGTPPPLPIAGSDPLVRAASRVRRGATVSRLN